MRFGERARGLNWCIHGMVIVSWPLWHCATVAFAFIKPPEFSPVRHAGSGAINNFLGRLDELLCQLVLSAQNLRADFVLERI